MLATILSVPIGFALLLAGWALARSAWTLGPAQQLTHEDYHDYIYGGSDEVTLR